MFLVHQTGAKPLLEPVRTQVTVYNYATLGHNELNILQSANPIYGPELLSAFTNSMEKIISSESESQQNDHCIIL